MTKKRNVVLIALMTIAMCSIMLMVGTYALFTDEVRLTTHLNSGTTEITLERTKLVATTLDNTTGYLTTNVNNDTVDFSAPSNENVFGISGNDLIVPCCSFDATMKISNGSDTAFSWWLAIEYDNSATVALADQLKVTVTIDGVATTSSLSQGLALGSETQPKGTLAKSAAATFNVKVEFIDNTAINNAAQDQNLNFDLVVYAIQATQAPQGA